jgi:NADPH:quinone reductase-like Zn-dependent oxidoreductase
VVHASKVDAVLDPLGDWLFDEALRALVPEGTVLVVGFAAGQIPQVKLEPPPAAQRLRGRRRLRCVFRVRPGAHGLPFEELPELRRSVAWKSGEIPGKGVVLL